MGVEGRLLRRVWAAAMLAAGLGMPAPAGAQPMAYVLGDRAGTTPDLVTVIDTATNTKVGSIQVGVGGAALFGAGLAVSPDGSRVYVVNSTDNTISVISTATHTVVATIPAGTGPTTIVPSPDGSRLYVGNRSSGSSPTSIRIIDAASGVAVGAITVAPLPVFATLGMAISPDGRFLYATAWTGMSTGYSLKVVDLGAGGVSASIPLQQFPSQVAITPDGATVYVGQMTTGTGTVSAISTATHSIVANIAVGVNPQSLAVAPDGTRVFVPANGVPFSVAMINRFTNTVTGTIPGQQHMRAIAFTPDGTRALAPWDNGVAVFNAVNNTYVGSVPMDVATEGSPRSVVVLPMPPDPPTDLVATSIAGNQVSLNWRRPLGGPPPTSFAVEGGLLSGQVLATLPTGSALPSFTFTAPTGIFYVRVRAMVGGLAGGPSNEIRIFVSPPQPPSAPESLLGLVDGSSVALAWRNTFAGGGTSAIALDVTGSLSTSLTLPPGEGFTFSGVPPGTYTFSVRATNPFGSSGASNAVTLTFPGPCSGIPAAPENLLVYKSGSRVSVFWTTASTGAAPTHFVLTVTGAFAGSFTTSERTMSGVVGPGTYNISVAAANVCGQSPATAPQSVTVP